MNQLGLVFDGTEKTPETRADTKPVQTVTGLGEINSETGPIEICSLDNCEEEAARWVVFDHAPVFTAFCSEHAPPNPWWTPEGGDRLTPTAEAPHPDTGHPDRSAGAQA